MDQIRSWITKLNTNPFIKNKERGIAPLHSPNTIRNVDEDTDPISICMKRIDTTREMANELVRNGQPDQVPVGQTHQSDKKQMKLKWPFC